MTDAGSSHQPPALQLNGPLTRESLDGLLPRIVSLSLPTFLRPRRWFGHKRERIASVNLVDRAVVESSFGLFGLCVVRLGFASSGDADYFIPLAFVTATQEPNSVLATVEGIDDQCVVVDAPATPSFRAWVARQLASGATVHGQAGLFVWDRSLGMLGNALTGDAEQSRVISAEQSNTSIVYGESMILKLFRRVETGLSPDVELGRFLSDRTTFRNMPLLLGDIRYVGLDRNARSLAVAHQFVPSTGDGWSYTLDALTAILNSTDGAFDRSVAEARKLGLRTAQLHLALASDLTDPSLRPEPISDADVARWSREIVTSMIDADRALADASSNLSSQLVELIRAFRERTDLLRTSLSGLAGLIGSNKIRVHGDYHLGQTLRTRDSDWVILDFEGEPQRSLDERRRKTTPLKDVAGMLRSFGYARGTAARPGPQGSDSTYADLSVWHTTIRSAFLDAYFDEAQNLGAPLLPESREEFCAALAPWELEKALYEVQYELSNRPDWLWLPLRATLELG